MKNYKKIYEDYFGIKWDPKQFEIHHLDMNRENNNISNLVLLPKKLHKEYHRLVSLVQYDFKSTKDILLVSNWDIIHAKEYQQLFELKFDIANLDIFQTQIRMIADKNESMNYSDLLKNHLIQYYKKYVGE